jgi:hypothetical protein
MTPDITPSSKVIVPMTIAFFQEQGVHHLFLLSGDLSLAEQVQGKSIYHLQQRNSFSVYPPAWVTQVTVTD